MGTGMRMSHGEARSHQEAARSGSGGAAAGRGRGAREEDEERVRCGRKELGVGKKAN